MRAATMSVVLTLLVGASLQAPTLADSLPLTSAADAALTAVAVHVDRTPKQPWPGYGVYIGNGYVLTAAHVAGTLATTNPQVEIGGKVLRAQAIRQGTFEEDDLTLLRVDENELSQNLRLRRITLCNSEPPLGSSVVVSTPEGVAASHLVAPKVLTSEILSRYPTLIGDVATTGNSGSGVFDQKTHCLLGIMSRKITLQGFALENGQKVPRTVDVAKYFIPFDKIRSAISSYTKF